MQAYSDRLLAALHVPSVVALDSDINAPRTDSMDVTTDFEDLHSTFLPDRKYLLIEKWEGEDERFDQGGVLEAEGFDSWRCRGCCCENLIDPACVCVHSA